MNYFMQAKEVEEKLATISQERIKLALKDAFAGLASGQSVQPAQTIMLLPNDDGDCIYYPGALCHNDLIGIKVSPYLAGLAKAGKYPVTAFTMLLSTKTGQPVLLCDSLSLTTIRTAATTSLALDYLIPSSAQTLSIFGTGKVALAHLEFISQQHQWQEILVYSPNLLNEANAKKRERFESSGIALTFAKSAREAVENADVVALCTSSGKPVIQTDWLKENAVVTSISTNVPKAHEISPKELQQYQVYCDYRRTAPLSAGEMVIAREEYGWKDSLILADLPELVTGKYSVTPTASERIFFRSIGLGIEDLAIASLLIQEN